MLPSSSDKEPFRDRLNTWTQTVGIVVAGIWACYAFVYKEIRAPRLAPVNVSVDLSLQPAPGHVLHTQNTTLIPIQLTISARNPSSRTVALLPSAFIVNAFNYDLDNANFDNELTSGPVHGYDGTFVQRHVRSVHCTTIATGSAAPDDSLRPGEVLQRSLIIYVPENAYDVLEAGVAFPTTILGSDIQVRWIFDFRANALKPTYYVARAKSGEMTVSPSGSMASAYDLQLASTHTQLALPGSMATTTQDRH